MNLKDDPAHAANHAAALRRAGQKPLDTDEKETTKMFAGSSIGSVNDFDNVLKILDLISDTPKTRARVEHVRALEVEFAKLAKEQSEFAKLRTAHAAHVAAKDKELAGREDEIARRENAIKAAEARVANLENDLHRRLAILKAAAA